MVNQSDLPFRILVRQYDASLVYTQMLLPERLLNDTEYLEFHRRGLHDTPDAPVVVQLCGNDPEVVVRAARTVVDKADAIDLNLGCPQDAAGEGHYGGYLLEKKDWPLVESIVSALSHSLPVPVSTKIRLCQNTALTSDLGVRLEAAGSSWITLHARHVSARRRRQGAADLEQVRVLKETVGVPVVSNGNVRTWEDVQANRKMTGADGVMVGETLLANPCLFANVTPDPVKISLEYLEVCREHPGTATMQTIQTHVRHFVDHHCSRRSWFNKFRAALGRCDTIDAIEKLLRVKVQRWRGLPPLSDGDIDDLEEGTTDEDGGGPEARDVIARYGENAASSGDVDEALAGLSILS
ncbi:FMN-linked oxidoreductase [Dichomitus squalens]|uniref:tRNA-dihydrouridine synthase n=1 Tax=Dichomitus squalens TaxID=114155 RepID=A0A4Q9PGZ4_9APHY|nr:FMN-linked oxidoreductase [Dichomitus squalens]TBU51906.1 FMN-linked oxidoreductase [Dichomitus squalens]